MSGPAPAVAAVRSAVRRACADLPAGALVLVACSGGPDSLALAAAAAWLGRDERIGWRAGAVVVDHGLQPGSDAVAARAAEQCAALGLEPVTAVRVVVTGGASGPEAAARTARHQALGEAAAVHGAAAVLLGHTRDDQAEQVLLGLARGSGARSLAGMPERRGVLRRPLLALARATTRDACAAQGLVPWHDPTNADSAFARARVRERVLPVLEAELGPGVASALARTAAQLREDAGVLEAFAARLLDDARLAAPPREVALDAALLAAAPAALRRRALRVAVIEAGSPATGTHRAHVEAVDALLTDWHGQGRIDLPGGVGATRACGRLALARRPVGERASGRTQEWTPTTWAATSPRS